MSDACCHHPEVHDAPEAGFPAPGGRRWSMGVRFLGWCMAFTWMYSIMTGACPCCGRPGCPNAGLMGLLFASLMQWGRSLKALLVRCWNRYL